MAPTRTPPTSSRADTSDAIREIEGSAERMETAEARAAVERPHLTQECILSRFKTRMIEIASKSASVRLDS